MEQSKMGGLALGATGEKNGQILSYVDRGDDLIVEPGGFIWSVFKKMAGTADLNSVEFMKLFSDITKLETTRVELQKAQVQLEERRVVASMSVPTSEVVLTQSVVSSVPTASSRRSVRRQNHLEACAKLHDEDGFCYLLMFKIEKRKFVKQKLGAFPGVMEVLRMPGAAFDIDALRMLGYHGSGDFVHVDENVEMGNNLYGYLARTLFLFSHIKCELRDLIAEDRTDGDCMNARTKLGTKRKSSGSGEAIRRGYLFNPMPIVDTFGHLGGQFREDAIRIVREEITADNRWNTLCHHRHNTGSDECVREVSSDALLPEKNGSVELERYYFAEQYVALVPSDAVLILPRTVVSLDRPVFLTVSGCSDIVVSELRAPLLFVNVRELEGTSWYEQWVVEHGESVHWRTDYFSQLVLEDCSIVDPTRYMAARMLYGKLVVTMAQHFRFDCDLPGPVEPLVDRSSYYNMPAVEGRVIIGTMD